jgi:hypothetical protein
VDFFIDLLTADPQGFRLETAMVAGRVVPGVSMLNLPVISPAETREPPARGKVGQGTTIRLIMPYTPDSNVTYENAGCRAICRVSAEVGYP